MMKRLVCLLLALLLAITLCACKPEEPTAPDVPPENGTPDQEQTENGGQNNDQNQPQEKPEPTPEEKKQTIKQNLMLLMNDTDSSNKQSPLEILDTLFENYTAKNLTFTEPDPDHPKEIYLMNGNVMFEFESHRIQSVVTNNLRFLISHANGSNPTVVGVSSRWDMPNLLSSFNIDDSLLLELIDSPSGSDLEFPMLTEQHITVSDDLTTCTLSENYLLATLLTLFSANLPQTEQELIVFLENVQVGSLYTVSENKLELTFDMPTVGSTGKTSIKILASSDPTNGQTIEMTTVSEGTNNGLSAKSSTLVAFRNVKYLRERVYAAELEISMLVTAEQEVQGKKIASKQDYSTCFSIDRSKWTKPLIEVRYKNIVDNTIDGEHYDDSNVSVSHVLSCNGKEGTISYVGKSYDTVMASMTGTYDSEPKYVNLAVPDSVKQYAEEVFPLYADSISE